MARTAPKYNNLKISLKSSDIIKLLTKNAPRSERLGWIQMPDAKLSKAVIAELRERSATTTLNVWGTETQKRDIDGIEDLIKLRLADPSTYNIPTEVKKEFDTAGLLMTEGTQHLFYKGIRELKKEHQQRRRTRAALAMTHYAVREISTDTPTESQIWKSIRDKDIPKNIRSFLWKSLHGAYCLRDFWNNIPNFEHRGTCNLCGGIESMEHILVECEDSQARKVIWKLAEEL